MEEEKNSDNRNVRGLNKTPSLPHSSTPPFPPSNTPTLQHSHTPPLPHVHTPTLHPSARPAVFLDRDGTLNEMVYDETHGLLDSPHRPDQLRMVEGAGVFVRALRDLGFFVVVVTNQPGIAKGTLAPGDLDAINERLRRELEEEGTAWDALYLCPHHPEYLQGKRSDRPLTCKCRKPKPGMLLQAARDHGLDLSRSWMIGDGLNDIQAGRAAGCRTILLAKVKIEQIERFSIEQCEPDAIAATFSEAVRAIEAAREIA